jgi:hypothetical protein
VNNERLRVVRATLIAVVLASGFIVADSQIPEIEPCDYITNSFMRWLLDCPPLDSGAS